MQCDGQKRMLEVSELSFGYGERNNLECIDLHVNPGEFVALMGPNGSGKTTMMRCINKILKIRSGNVKVDDVDILRLPMAEIAKICTTVPADAPLDFSLTVREFVSLGRTPFITSGWWEKKEDNDIIDRAMWDLGITRYADRRLHELSSGERARVLLAKGVVQTPKVILVDEPSAHLDIKYKVQVMEILKDLSKKGLSILIASHDINLLTRFCDRIVLLSKGRIVASGTAEEVVTKESIKEVFDIEVEIVTMNDTVYVLPTGSVMKGEMDANVTR